MLRVIYNGLLAVAFLICCAPGASAATAVLNFSATTAAANSVVISGQYILDTETAGTNGHYSPAIVSATVFVGSVQYSSVPGERTGDLFIKNNVNDEDSFVLESNLTSVSGDSGFIGIVLADSSSSIFSSTAIPLEDFELSQFDGFGPNFADGSFLLALSVGQIGNNFAEFDSLTYTIVPIPAGIVLMLSALATMSAVRVWSK